MEFKVVYNCENGSPIMLKKENENQDYVYPEEPYTELEPPQGIYAPFSFDGSEWVGSNKEDWEKENPPSVYDPSDMEKTTANLQMQLMKSNITQMQVQQQVASLMLDNKKKDIAIKDLQAQQAQMMLEITKLKGGN